MMSSTAKSYDDVPYLSLPSSRTHPSRLAAIGRLFGLAAPSLHGCRILELGCAGGGNILPMAVDYPDGQFIGIDISPRQVKAGQQIAREIGLENLSLRALDIMAFPEDYGRFDYIICHGVYSWVPRPVQDQILDICSRHLTPQGIAFVSYNVYPGWHLRAVVRDMMRYHVRAWHEPSDRIDQARALLDVLVKTTAGRTDAFQQLLRDEAEIVSRHDDSYLFHEHLEDVNEALYFHEFLERLGPTSLQYLGDTDFTTMLPLEFGPEIVNLLKQAPLEVHEQYLDFFRNRAFRGSLVCHRNQPLQRQMDLARLRGLEVAIESLLHEREPSGWETPPSGATVPISANTLSTATDRTADPFSSRAPITQAALVQLTERWPMTIPYPELERQVLNQLGGAALSETERTAQIQLLGRDLLNLYARRYVRLSVDTPTCTRQLSARPTASPLVRWQAQYQRALTSQRHEALEVTDIAKCLLPYLDGQHELEMLAGRFAQSIANQEYVFRINGNPVTEIPLPIATQVVQRALETFARDALLVA